MAQGALAPVAPRGGAEWERAVGAAGRGPRGRARVSGGTTGPTRRTALEVGTGGVGGEGEEGWSGGGEGGSEGDGAAYRGALARGRSSAAAAELLSTYRFVYWGGSTSDGVPLVVFAPHMLPRAVSGVSESTLLSCALEALLAALDGLTQGPFAIVYAHAGADWLSRGRFGWMQRIYWMLPRRWKKNLVRLYVLHPTLLVRSFFSFAGAFLSRKFARKLVFCHSVDDVLRDCRDASLLLPRAIARHGDDSPPSLPSDSDARDDLEEEGVEEDGSGEEVGGGGGGAGEEGEEGEGEEAERREAAALWASDGTLMLKARCVWDEEVEREMLARNDQLVRVTLRRDRVGSAPSLPLAGFDIPMPPTRAESTRIIHSGSGKDDDERDRMDDTSDKADDSSPSAEGRRRSLLLQDAERRRQHRLAVVDESGGGDVGEGGAEEKFARDLAARVPASMLAMPSPRESSARRFFAPSTSFSFGASSTTTTTTTTSSSASAAVVQRPYLFGARLEDILDVERSSSSGPDAVPRLVTCCTRALEGCALAFEGLYRVSASVPLRDALIALLEETSALEGRTHSLGSLDDFASLSLDPTTIASTIASTNPTTTSTISSPSTPRARAARAPVRSGPRVLGASVGSSPPASPAAAAVPAMVASTSDEEFRSEALALYKKLRSWGDGAEAARSPKAQAPQALSTREAHVVASVMLRFLREVPGSVWGGADVAARVLADPSADCAAAVVAALPPHRGALLRAVLAHFRRVAANAPVNRMDLDTLAVVVGPAIFPRSACAVPAHPLGAGPAAGAAAAAAAAAAATVAHYGSLIPATLALLQME